MTEQNVHVFDGKKMYMYLTIDKMFIYLTVNKMYMYLTEQNVHVSD
jgi:hypothetical protein